MKDSISGVIAQADAEISALGHAPSTLWQYRWAWAQFEAHAAREGIVEVSDDSAASFVRLVNVQAEQGQVMEWKRKLLRKAVLVLAEVAATGTYRWKVFRPTSANDVLSAAFRPVQEQYEDWLDRQPLAAATSALNSTVSRKVLAWLPEHGVREIHELSGTDVTAVVVFLSESYAPGSMRSVVSALRVLCRFLEESGQCSLLVQAIPARGWRRVISVAVVPPERIEELTNSPDPDTPAGRRDRAMLLLAARTGLRPVDIVNLRLSDIDWAQQQITLVQHKTGALLVLPLLADVGEAIADYLLHARARGVEDDHVFLRVKAPHVALSSSSLHYVAARAFERTATGGERSGGRGFRMLRTSLASRLLTDGTALPVLAGALGHRGIASVKHYLSVDEEPMRACCLDLVGIEPRTEPAAVRP